MGENTGCYIVIGRKEKREESSAVDGGDVLEVWLLGRLRGCGDGRVDTWEFRKREVGKAVQIPWPGGPEYHSQMTKPVRASSS